MHISYCLSPTLWQSTLSCLFPPLIIHLHLVHLMLYFVCITIVKISSIYLHSKTVRARELNFWKKVHFPHLSHIRCHMSYAICHVSLVTCHFFFFLQRRVCYQGGLPHLVSSQTPQAHCGFIISSKYQLFGVFCVCVFLVSSTLASQYYNLFLDLEGHQSVGGPRKPIYPETQNELNNFFEYNGKA